MKLIKLILAGSLMLTFSLAQDTQGGGQQGGQPESHCDPNADYPNNPPGEGQGCGNYEDCNGNGAFDLGEPCFDSPPFGDVDASGDGVIDRDEARAFFGDDPNFEANFTARAGEDGVVDPAEYAAGGPGEGGEHGGQEGQTFYCGECDMEFGSEAEMHQHMEEHHHPGGGEPDPVWEAFTNALANGATPEEAFQSAADKVYELEVASGNMTEAEYNEGKEKAWAAFQEALANGATPEDAFGAAAATAEGPPPTNHYDANCGAICGNMGDYFVDTNGNGQIDDVPEEGPFAIWHQDADGNDVNCNCGGGNN